MRLLDKVRETAQKGSAAFGSIKELPGGIVIGLAFLWAWLIQVHTLPGVAEYVDTGLFSAVWIATVACATTAILLAWRWFEQYRRLIGVLSVVLGVAGVVLALVCDRVENQSAIAVLSSIFIGLFYAYCLVAWCQKGRGVGANRSAVLLVVSSGVLYGLVCSFFSEVADVGYRWVGLVSMLVVLACIAVSSRAPEGRPDNDCRNGSLWAGEYLFILLLGASYGLFDKAPNLVSQQALWSLAAVLAGLLCFSLYCTAAWPKETVSLVFLPLAANCVALLVLIASLGVMAASLVVAVGLQLTLFTVFIAALLRPTARQSVGMFACFFLGLAAMKVCSPILVVDTVSIAAVGVTLTMAGLVLVLLSRFSSGHRGAMAIADMPEKDMRRKSNVNRIFEGMGLSPCEVKVAALLVRGYTLRKIAHELGVSESTIGTQTQSVYKKAGVHSKQDFIDLMTALCEDDRRTADE